MVDSSIGQNTNTWSIHPAQSTSIEPQPITPPLTNASNMVNNVTQDLFKAATNSLRPPQPTQTTGFINKVRNLTTLGIKNILGPITIELFKRNAQLALQSPELTPEEKVKIETARYKSAFLNEAAISLVTKEVAERIIKNSQNYKLRPNALPLALAITKVVGKETKDSFREEIMKELSGQGELFDAAFNDPATLDQALSLIVTAVDSLMDEARTELNTPGPKMQEAAKQTLKLADLAIAAESATRVLQQVNKKHVMLGITPRAIA